MKKARYVTTGEMILASEADHTDYPGIFECPVCKAALYLRKEYTRGDGVKLEAAFVHPSTGTPEQLKCPLRVSFDMEAAASDLAQGAPSRGQIFKRLKNNLLKHMKIHSGMDVWDYFWLSKNKKPRSKIQGWWEESQKDRRKAIDDFVEAAAFMLGLQYSEAYIERQRDLIRDKVSRHTSDSEREIRQRTSCVIWGMQFLVSTDNDFRQSAIAYILGDGLLQAKIDLNPEEQTIFTTTSQALETALTFRHLPREEIANFFVCMNQNKESSSRLDRLEFANVQSFYTNLLELAIDYFCDFNWPGLLEPQSGRSLTMNEELQAKVEARKKERDMEVEQDPGVISYKEFDKLFRDIMRKAENALRKKIRAQVTYIKVPYLNDFDFLES